MRKIILSAMLAASGWAVPAFAQPDLPAAFAEAQDKAAAQTGEMASRLKEEAPERLPIPGPKPIKLGLHNLDAAWKRNPADRLNLFEQKYRDQFDALQGPTVPSSVHIKEVSILYPEAGKFLLMVTGEVMIGEETIKLEEQNERLREYIYSSSIRSYVVVIFHVLKGGKVMVLALTFNPDDQGELKPELTGAQCYRQYTDTSLYVSGIVDREWHYFVRKPEESKPEKK